MMDEFGNEGLQIKINSNDASVQIRGKDPSTGDWTDWKLLADPNVQTPSSIARLPQIGGAERLEIKD